MFLSTFFMLLKEGSWLNIKTIFIHDALQFIIKPLYNTLWRLEWTCVLGGAILKIPMYYIAFSLPNWMVGKGLVTPKVIKTYFPFLFFQKIL